MSRQAKPGSKPYRAQLRDRLTALGFPEEALPAQVAKNLVVECRIPPRTAWRLASELSLDVAAHQYNAVTGDPRAGMRGTRIWEYEQWPERGVRPTVAALRVLAQVYGTNWKCLLGLRDLEQLPAKDLAEYHAETEPAVVAPEPEAPPVRALFRTEGRSEEEIGAGALDDALLLTKTNVDDVQLDDLWADLDFLGGAYTRTAPDSILGQLAVIADRTSALLKGRQRPKQTQDLLLIGAKSSAMMAWIAGDLGRYRLSRELNTAAWLYTQYADDLLARRWVRTSQARVAFWAGNGIESAKLAADGLNYHAGGRLTDAPLILAEARGWSSVQAEPQVLAAIARWTAIEDPDLGAGGEDSFFNITKDRRHYMAGTSLLSVGQASAALREFATAREAFEKLSLENRWEAMDPMIRIDMGRAHLRLDDLEGAAAQVEPLLTAGVGKQPDMVRAMLKLMATELSGPRWRSATTARHLAEALLDAHASARP
ncbi:hypothetical protein SAMN04489727_4759 [Amycolatopsis tolypomycina]|uniref:Uncharacterized protein n=1 Tax=Amycolatopsis tolypomycina TaxID=208445 RepID=A0A1H4UPF1_9PSEU|nr:hypothetical protein [Amycolatopsis tolypomycina]SEC70410.1 hypothetical protein SAMN04489727_4759 [Amycolatopsis tolypomycina]